MQWNRAKFFGIMCLVKELRNGPARKLQLPWQQGFRMQVAVSDEGYWRGKVTLSKEGRESLCRQGVRRRAVFPGTSVGAELKFPGCRAD